MLAPALALILAAGAPELPPLAVLLQRARDEKLARDPQWLRLGHWRRGLLGGFESEVDGPGFFLSPGGKADPALELAATIAGLVSDELSGPDVHARCRFPARLAFLAARLGLDPEALPRRECQKLEEWLSRTRARGATLVFSSYYMNNPASAFGHTFLRLDREPRLGERVELVDQGIDYAATVDTRNAVLYAFKGLTGLFHGEFSARPYFYKVREYADFESRDLWEYRLDLPQEAVDLLVAHLWELGQTWFDYYYLTENCSYHILGALEAADERVALLRHVGWITIPADTVKALFRNPGLVTQVHYRPSARTVLEHRMAPMPAAERRAALEVAAQPEAPLPAGLGPPEQARVLDAALDIADVRLGKAIIREEPAALELRQALLARRSSVPVATPPLDIPAPAAGGPEHGHGSSRAGLGGGASREGGALAVLDWRLALHDLADPPAGFSPATRLEFLSARIRLEGFEAGGKVLLDEAMLVSAASMTPLDRLDPRTSWKLRAGASRVRDGGCSGCVAADLEVGGGATLGAGPVSLLATADARLQAAPDLQGAGGSGWRPGLGPSAVLRIRGGERVALLATAGWAWLPWSSPEQTWDLSVVGRLHLGRVSLFAEGRKTPVDAEVLGGAYVFY